MTGLPASLSNVKSGAISPSRSIATSKKRAIGVVRVSRVGEREGERFVSPSEQRERIRAACERDGMTLIDTLEEMDVSGSAPLADRPGLRRAVELVEVGEADVVVVAFFDRLVRSLSVQVEVVNRVEAAHGSVLAVDVGAVSHGSSAQWLSGTMLGAVSEYARRVTAERTADAKRRAVERGVAPYPNLAPGFRRGNEGQLETDPATAGVVADAFRLRADGATVMEVRDHLRRHGIARSYHGTQAMLTSRVYLGELRFGALVNLESHAAIVDPQTWAAVQRMRSPRGRRAKSERLLARLGVLRCATCGSRMVVGTSNHSTYHLYRCPPNGDCPRRVSISAELAERVVVDAVRELLTGMRGTATLEEGVAEAVRELDGAEQALVAAVEAFTGLDDVDAARDRLLQLRDARDRARDRLNELGAATAPAVTITAAEDWDALTIEEQRALIRAVVEQATVSPGRGCERISVTARS